MSTLNEEEKGILKQKAFKRAIKPAEAFSFYWYITGLLHSKSYSERDSDALRRYRNIGYSTRLHLAEG